MKDYEKPWMEIVCINADVITDSCDDDTDVTGPGFDVCISAETN